MQKVTLNSQKNTGMADVLVIGAGVTGIQAALDLADHGIHVHLVEQEPSIGGHMSQLDKTFPTNDCSMCILSPKMVDVCRHPNIRVHTCTEIERVEGSEGHFNVTLRKNPRYIIEELCNGCGDCIEICPVEVYNEFDAGMGVRKAIYKPHPQAVPDIVIRDPGHCIECGLCYDACLPGAVKKEDSVVTTEIQAGSIIIATGYGVFDARKKGQFRYLEFPDVITSLELERMINASGPTGGCLKRLVNGTGTAQYPISPVCRLKGYPDWQAMVLLCLLHGFNKKRNPDKRKASRNHHNDLLYGCPGLWERI